MKLTHYLDAGMAGHLMPAARGDPRLGRSRQPTLAKPLTPRLVEPFCVPLMRKHAYDIVRVAHQACLALASWCDHLQSSAVLLFLVIECPASRAEMI